MPTTPEDPREPGSDKLELPSLGGLLRRRKRSATPEPAEPAEPIEAAGPVGSDDTQPVRVVETPGEPAVEATTVIEPVAPEPVVAQADDGVDDEADEADEADLTAPIDWGGEDPQPERQPDRGPDLVAPSAAYAEVPDDEQPAAAPRRERRRPRLPSFSLPELHLPLIPERYAAALTGVVVGLVGVLLIYLAQLGCGAVRGAGSCGGAGVPLLLVALVLMVFAGTALLRAWLIEEPTSTSFLGVGLIAVVSMLVLLPVIDRWFMVIVIPVVGAAAYALSWFVTSKFDAPEKEAARERENAR